jgi:hydrogenase nickel incorporation protein HypB
LKEDAMCDSCGGHAEQEPHGHDHGHEHGHDHGHGHGHKHEARIAVDPAQGSVLDSNGHAASRVRADLTRRGILMLNLTSGPGSGKTALLKATLAALEPKSTAVLVGDLETDRDAARLRGMGAQVRQINTGKGCHLSATQVANGLERLDLDGLEFLFVENVGNMACPAEFDLGEHARVAVLSLPEGDDKVAKYPGLFAAAHVVVLNKIDLARVLPFDEGQVREDLSRVNTRAPLIRLSAIGGQGMEEWLNWLKAFRASVLKPVAL